MSEIFTLVNRISAWGILGTLVSLPVLHRHTHRTPSMRGKFSLDAESAGSLNADISISSDFSFLINVSLLLLLLYSPCELGWWRLTFVLLLSLYQHGNHFYSWEFDTSIQWSMITYTPSLSPTSPHPSYLSQHVIFESLVCSIVNILHLEIKTRLFMVIESIFTSSVEYVLAKNVSSDAPCI